MNQIQAEVIFLNLLRQSDEFVFSILGTNPAADAGSFRARVSALYSIFNADKYNFVQSPTHLGFLATLIKEYGAFRKSEITQIGTPEILIGQIRWDDIYDKPDILAASSDWADITSKPATFPPDAHAHDYASITSKPATYPPDAHAHDYASITSKPATYPPDAHAHDYASISGKPSTFQPRLALISYTGSGTATRILSFAGGFLPTGGVWNNHSAGTSRILIPGDTMFDLTTSTITTPFNINGAPLHILLFG